MTDQRHTLSIPTNPISFGRAFSNQVPSPRLMHLRPLVQIQSFFVAVLAGLVLLLLAACSSDTVEESPAVNPLSGGVLATFEVSGKRFSVWVTNTQTINDLFSLQSGQSNANIPNGVTRIGPGRAEHNAPYGWHMDPEQISMAELAIELCDGSPTYVDENLSDWQEQVGRYCPWGAELVSLEDHRQD